MKVKMMVTADRKRINWSQITSVSLSREDGVLIGKIKWKYKASIKTEEFALNLKDHEIGPYFKRVNFAPLTTNLYVNVEKIMMIEEDQIFGAVEKTKVRMLFLDGFEISEKMEPAQWSWWKTSFLT